MVFQTFEGTLFPDGKISLQGEKLPEHPVRVMVTILDVDEGSTLSELGDYNEKLMDYEERLLRGEVQWQ